jgi:subtilisin family serine protease
VLASLLLPMAGLALTLGSARGAPRAPLPASLVAKLDPRLVARASMASLDPIPVWLTFADKGERGRGDLVTRLAMAEAALTPRARARRERAGVWPLVDYRDLPVDAGHLAALRSRGLTILAWSRWLNRAAVRVPGAQLAALAGLPFVAHIDPVERMMHSADPAGGGELPPQQPPLPTEPTRSQALGAPPPIDYGRTLHMLRQMNVPAVHDSGYIGTGVLVCIVDDGFKLHDTHEALSNTVIPPGMVRDFVDGDTDVNNPESVGHGTWVMGCIAGNLQGAYVGSGFGAQFALARTEVDASETPVEMLYWGMGAEWADSLGADLITSSLGYTTFNNAADNYTYADMDGHTTDVTRAAEIAASKGILVVSAVGNEGNTTWHYLVAPSDVQTDSLIAVGAVDQTGLIASFSSFGPRPDGTIKPDLVARGALDTLVSNTVTNGYLTLSGTSFATPLVAGLATCLLQARPAWAPTIIAQALRATASRASSPDNQYGWGIPDGLAVLRWCPPVCGVPPLWPRFGVRLIGPNPLRASGAPLQIQFGLGQANRGATPARVRVFDAQGRAVRELFSGTLEDDQTVAVTWDGRNGDGGRVRTGLYVVALESGDHLQGARVVVLP